jgi:hypothetical protein
MRDVFAFLGLVWSLVLVLGAVVYAWGCAWRWVVQRLRDRRAIARVIVDSHRWDTWAKSHAGGGR